MKTAIKLLSLILSFVILMTVFPAQVFAETTTIVASGFCGGDISAAYDSASDAYKNLTWTLYDNGTLVIDGKGVMKNYDYTEDAITTAHGAIT